MTLFDGWFVKKANPDAERNHLNKILQAIKSALDAAIAGGVNTVQAGTGIDVDSTDSNNPVVSVEASIISGAADGATAVQPGDNVSVLTNDAGYTTNVGTVTSVAVSGTDGVEVDSGSPITTAGTIQLGLSATVLGQLADASTALQPGDNVSELTNDSGYTTNTGTVTSVAAANATGITWTGSPITTSGTLTPTLSTNLQAWSGVTTASKADDSAVVHLAGAESITGAKTFTGVTRITGQTLAFVRGGGTDARITLEDSAGTRRGLILVNPSTGVGQFIAYDTDGGTPLGTLHIGTGGITYDGSEVWTASTDGAGSGLDADLLDGAQLDSSAGTANTVAGRNGSGDIFARLFRSNFANQGTISGAMAFRINNSSDDYIRFCSDAAAIRTFLGLGSANLVTFAGGVFSDDISVSRAGAPTTGVVYLGNSGTRYLYYNGTTYEMPGAALNVGGAVSDSIGNLRDVIGVTRNSTTAFAAADAGKAIVKTDTTAYTWAVNTSVWYYGMTVTVINDGSAGNVTISQGAGMTLISGSTTGNFTLAPGESRTLYGLSATRVRVL